MYVIIEATDDDPIELKCMWINMKVKANKW
jgi:hypothetical protein